MLNRLGDFLTQPRNIASFEPISLSIVTAECFSFDNVIEQLAIFCSHNVDKLLEVISGEWENEIFEHFVIFLPLETLELVHQRDQTKAQLLYKARTSSILSVDDLHRCKYANCRKLFTLQQHQLLKMQYPECFHCRDGRFNGIAFVTSLADKHGWRDTFWLIWGETKMFRCAKCLRFFKMTDSNGCTHGQHVFHETVPKDITNCGGIVKSVSHLSNEFVEAVQDQSTFEDDLAAARLRGVRPGRVDVQPKFSSAKNAELWRMDRIRELDMKNMKELEKELKQQRSITLVQ